MSPLGLQHAPGQNMGSAHQAAMILSSVGLGLRLLATFALWICRRIKAKAAYLRLTSVWSMAQHKGSDPSPQVM